MKTNGSEFPLVFLGSGGFARELLGWMAHDSLWDRPVAMIQDEVTLGETQLGIPVKNFDAIQHPVRFIVAVSPPELKERLVKKAMDRGWTPATYIDQTAIVGLNTDIKIGCVVTPYCIVSTNVVLGNFVTLNCRSGVGHESTIGEYSTLLGGNQVNGNVHIGAHALLGSGSIIHPGRTIGNRATIGIGSVVLNNVKDGTVVFGSPAKRIQYQK